MKPKPLFIRGFDPQVVGRIKLAAWERRITLAEYITRLVKLHDTIQWYADNGSASLQAELKCLGLETVRRGVK